MFREVIIVTLNQFFLNIPRPFHCFSRIIPVCQILNLSTNFSQNFELLVRFFLKFHILYGHFFNTFLSQKQEIGEE